MSTWLETFTMAPPLPRWIIPLAMIWDTINTWRTLTFIVLSQLSTEASKNGDNSAMPALFTSKSISPAFSAASLALDATQDYQ